MGKGIELKIKVGINFEFLQQNYDPKKKEKQGFCLEGSGGCFAPTQRIVTKDGVKMLSEIKNGDFVLSFNEKTKEEEYRQVEQHHVHNNKKKCFRITLKNGSVIECTEDHKFYHEGAWIEIKYYIPIWNEILSVEEIFIPITNDITIEHNSNYYLYCNGTKILVHNSGKTYDVLQFIIYYCELHAYKNKDILVTRESYAECKKTVLKDFIKILKSYGLYDQKCHRESHPQQYTYKGNTISFSGLDDSSAHGDRRDFIYFNELLLSDDDKAYKQLQGRCAELFIADWNPIYTIHWAYDQLLSRPDTKLFKSTFRTNPYLPIGERNEKLGYEPTPENIKNGTADEFMWRVYGLGERAAREGVIFKYITYIPEFPENVNYWYGLDFGYTCFASETKVTTINGEVNISEIKKGDLVLTRSGYRKVAQVHNRGIQKVVKKYIGMDFGYKEIICTLDHKFNTKKEWKQLAELQESDQLFMNVNLMDKFTEDTKMGNIRTTFIQKIKNQYFTGIFGKKLMGKFRKVNTFTILMGIRLIMILKTLCLSQMRNIENSTIILKDLLLKIHLQKKIGKKEDRKLLKTYKKKKERVSLVGLVLSLQMFIKNSVIASVIINGNIQVLSVMNYIFVKFVEKLTTEINTLNKKLVQNNVDISYHQIQELKTIDEFETCVYDLTIENSHEYFANGFLVHNCDPTALAKIYIDEEKKELYAECLMYESTENPMLINDYFNSIEIEKFVPITADSSDKYISQAKGAVEFVKDLKTLGWNISKVSKTKDRYYWICKAKEYKIFIVASPKNPEITLKVKREFENFMWRTINGIQVNQPVDKFDHFITAMLYGMMGNKSTQRRNRAWN